MLEYRRNKALINSLFLNVGLRDPLWRFVNIGRSDGFTTYFSSCDHLALQRLTQINAAVESGWFADCNFAARYGREIAVLLASLQCVETAAVYGRDG